ncbi:hypothetical protein BVRB_033980, partial [Beta vulgaris subsp. vulgaris]
EREQTIRKLHQHIEAISSQMRTLENRIEEQDQTIGKLRQQNELASNEIKKLETEIGERDRATDRLRQQSEETDELMEQLNADIQEKDQIINELRQHHDEVDHRIEGFQTEIEKRDRLIGELRLSVASSSGRIEQLQNEVTRSTQCQQCTRLQDIVNNLEQNRRNDGQIQYQHLHQLRQQIRSFKHDMAEIGESVKILQGEVLPLLHRSLQRSSRFESAYKEVNEHRRYLANL